MADELFGWDLTYRLIEKELTKKEDLLIAFTHWFIIKNGFSCIGNGDSKTVKGNEIKTESLSSGWNQNEDYNIRYLYGEKLYLLRAYVTGGDIILNFLRADDLCISSCVFKVEDTVKQIKGNIQISMPDYKNVISILRKDLIEPVFIKTTHSAVETQTTEKIILPTAGRPDPFSPDGSDTSTDPLTVPLRRPIPMSGLDPLWTDPLRDPNTVGRNDLDPFSPGIGGGMIFDPLNPRNDRSLDPIIPGPSVPRGLPRGAVPPGARFDPLGPPNFGRNGGRRIDPDPDHLPPPGYDDMFIDSGPPDSSLDSRNNSQRGRGRGRGNNDQNPNQLNSSSFDNRYM
ncbi:proteasome inhibitor, putative [Pediculus humanus corporis]|uniref:Proteasome inhibitor PI31 subunit n=1 Tax=Pediculus humanus subsp. corporis TaxID=121224 RepID=E0W495_PEDHC|nr:proteasome inhibitor, putative [Pediculus humanus corporis]EEB20451.1 proteasome inhibitor, putative [Pediculus humanus corporis]